MPIQPYLGEITMFAGNFAPKNWAFCNGQILSIAQNTALFSLLGTTYGGNGQTTFALPDLRGRTPLQWGQGPGLSPYDLGEASGTENVTLTINEMPAHNHAISGGGQASITLPCSTSAGDNDSPVGRIPAVTPAGEEQYADASAANAQMAGNTVNIPAPTLAPNGGSQPHNNLSPYLAVTYIIALQGVFPSRN
jgi:microcystin-dependent protein